MTPRVALIVGVTGQDGAYLSELLLDKGFAGLVREMIRSDLETILDEPVRCGRD